MSAAGAFIEMTAERAGATPRNGQEHFDMLPGDPLTASFDECVSRLVLAQHGFLECELVHCRIVRDLPRIPVIALQMPFERLDRRAFCERH